MEMSFRVFRASHLSSSSSGTILLNSSPKPSLPILSRLPNPNRISPSAFLHTSPSSKPNSPKPLPSSGGGFPSRFGSILRRSKSSSSGGAVAMAASTPVQKSEDEWRAILSPEQFRILRQKGTEVYLDDHFTRVDVITDPINISQKDGIIQGSVETRART